MLYIYEFSKSQMFTTPKKCFTVGVEISRNSCISHWKEVFSDSQMLSIRKMCNAGLSVVVFYTQSIGLAGEPDRPVFEYSNNLNVLIITKIVGPTEVTGGCDNFQLSDVHY